MPGMLNRILLSPGENRLRAGWRLALHLLLLALLTLLIGSAMGFVMALLGINFNPDSLLITQLLGFLAITSSVIIARWALDRRSFTSLGLGWDWQAAKDLLVGSLIPGLMMGLIALLEWAVGWLDFKGFAWENQSLAAISLDLLLILGVFTLVGWQEELLSRGYWLQNLAQGLSPFWGVAISSGMFGLLHWANPHASWAGMLGVSTAGVFLAFGYLRTHRLWLPIGLHLGWNFFEGPVFGFPVSGLQDLPHLIQQQVDGPVPWTGGAFGPEAGLVLLPALLLGAVLVYLYTRAPRVRLDSSNGKRP